MKPENPGFLIYKKKVWVLLEILIIFFIKGSAYGSDILILRQNAILLGSFWC